MKHNFDFELEGIKKEKILTYYLNLLNSSKSKLNSSFSFELQTFLK